MKKRVIGVAAAAVMMFCSIAFAAEFSDVSGNEWYANAVNFVSERNYFNGVSDYEFAPDSSMTRGMFVTVLGRFADVDRSEYTRDSFLDVEFDDWYYTYVTWASENGITDGYPDGCFYPDEPVNREQIAVMINRFLTSQSIDLTSNPNALTSYTDESMVSDWARSGVALMRTSAIFTGDQYGNFHPEKYGTRAEIANVIMRLWMVVNGGTLDVPIPEPMPTPEPVPPERARANQILSGMTLDEKIYQMFIVTPEQLTGVTPVTVAGEKTKAALESHPVGGILYSKMNIVSDYQLNYLVNYTKSYMKTMPFMAVTEECGDISQLSPVMPMPEWGYMYDYRDDGTDKAYEIGASIGEKIYEYGFNMNFAPVADVWSNARNSVIGERTFGTSPYTVAEMASAEARGLRDKGVAAVLKHFPGMGDTVTDSNSKIVTHKTLEQLNQTELVPFKKAIEDGADIVLCAHVSDDAVDWQYPASMSGVFINDILRTQLGFKGVVIADSLTSPAITNFYSASDAAINCINAGTDMLLSPNGIDETADAIRNAVNGGQISEERINESVRRILEVKVNRGIISY